MDEFPAHLPTLVAVCSLLRLPLAARAGCYMLYHQIHIYLPRYTLLSGLITLKIVVPVQ